MAELRWDTLHGEWVVTSAGDSNAASAAGPEVCHLCAVAAGEAGYDIAVFGAPSAVLQPEPPEPTLEGTELFQVATARGAREIVHYTHEHGAGLVEASVEKLDRVVRVWAARSTALAEFPFVRYVLVADGNGTDALAPDHPHGRIDAYPFVPPVAARELARAQEHFDRYHRCLLCDVLAAESREGQRIVVENRDFVAFAPFASRWPYEVQIAPRRHAQSLAALDREEMRSLAAILRSVLVAYATRQGRPFSYVTTVHQEPTDGREYYYYHLRIDLRTSRPPMGSGLEIGAGIHFNDAPAEATAAELRAAAPPAE